MTDTAGQGSVAKNSIMMLSAQLGIKVFSFFLPFMPPGRLALTGSANMAWPWP